MKLFKKLYGFVIAFLTTVSVYVPALADSGISSTPAGRIAICVLIGMLLGLIPMLVMLGQMKNVKRNNRASSYVRENSLTVTQQNDMYLYKNVTRTPIPKDKKD